MESKKKIKAFHEILIDQQFENKWTALRIEKGFRHRPIFDHPVPWPAYFAKWKIIKHFTSKLFLN